MGLLDNSFTPQYNEARYYGGKYSFTADSSLTVQEYTITKNFEDILRRRTGLPDANSPVPGSYKVYIENEFVIEKYEEDVTGAIRDNYEILWDDSTTPTTKGWYIRWKQIAPTNGQTFTIVFNQNDPNIKLGNYQFMPLSDIINNFMFTHIGEDKVIPKASRTDVAFHAQRALAELSFDTFKSCKSQEITIPPHLTMPLPFDYVNYVKLTSVDSAGIEHIIYPTSKTSNPRAIKQDADGTYSDDTNDDGVPDSFSGPTNSQYLYRNTTPGLIYDENSSAWNRYKSHEPAENNINDYQDYQDYQNDIYWPNEGRRFGLDPQHAQVNGSYYIDCHAGKIHFSSNLSGKTVILKYISDSLGTDHEMQVHKLAEEALYKWIMYGLLSLRRDVPEYVVQRYKKERFAETRKAKLRLSNIKLEEITQIFRGKSKQIKH